MSKGQRKIYWTIILMAVISSSLSVAYRMHSRPQLVWDEISYHKLGTTLASSCEYDSLTRAPGFPILVGIVYTITSPSVPAILIVNILLFVFTLMIVYKIAHFVTGNVNISLLTIGLCALWLPFIRSVSLFLTEIFAGFLTAVLLWLLLVVTNKPRLSLVIVTGILVGINVLTKAVMLPFILFAPLLFMMGDKDRRSRLALAGVMLLAATAVMIPWTIRNYRMTGCFVPVTLLSGLNFWYGNNPKTYVAKGQNEVISDYGYTNDRRAVEKDKKFMRAGFELVKENPIRSLRFAMLKFSSLWLGDIGKNPVSTSSYIPHIGSFGIPKMAFIHIPLFVLAIIGWFRLSAVSKRRAYPIITMFVLCTAAYVVLYAERRYAIPMEFYKIMFAAVAIGAMCGIYHTKSLKPAE